MEIRKKNIIILVTGIIFAVILIRMIFSFFSKGDRHLTVSGRVEAPEIELSSRIPGRLITISIEDGSAVNKGDVIATLEDDELRSKQRELVGSVAELSKKIGAAEHHFAYLEKNVEHTIEEALKGLAVAEARLRQADAAKENAEKELKRYSNLLQQGAVSIQQYDRISLSTVVAREDRDTALKDVERSKVSLMKAEDSRELIKAKQKEIEALEKSLDTIRENAKQVEINLGYTKIVAPAGGIILKKVAEPGEVITTGSIVGIMINPDNLHVKTYVPEKYIGKLSLHMGVEVFADAYPDRAIRGEICHISDKAEFTPKEIQSYEERVKQVFAVKICFPDTEGLKKDKAKNYTILKKGMPVDVRFSVDKSS